MVVRNREEDRGRHAEQNGCKRNNGSSPDHLNDCRICSPRASPNTSPALFGDPLFPLWQSIKDSMLMLTPSMRTSPPAAAAPVRPSDVVAHYIVNSVTILHSRRQHMPLPSISANLRSISFRLAYGACDRKRYCLFQQRPKRRTSSWYIILGSGTIQRSCSTIANRLACYHDVGPRSRKSAVHSSSTDYGRIMPLHCSHTVSIPTHSLST